MTGLITTRRRATPQAVSRRRCIALGVGLRVVIGLRDDAKGGNELLDQSDFYFCPDGRIVAV